MAKQHLKYYCCKFDQAVDHKMWSALLTEGLKSQAVMTWHNENTGYFVDSENLKADLMKLIGLWESEVTGSITLVISHCFDEFTRQALELAERYRKGSIVNLSEVALLAIVKNEDNFLKTFYTYFNGVDEELLATMTSYLSHNFLAGKTAESLYIHRNTWRYRYQKFQRLTGIDLQDFDDAIFFQTWLSWRKIPPTWLLSDK